MTLPAVNKKAPAINLLDQDGNKVTLKDFLGKPVIIYFCPKDDTPGCTTQACSLRDEFKKFKPFDAVILGISPDGPAKHTKFIDKYDLPFTLLADEDKKICEAYGVWGLKKFMGKEFMGVLRTTFVINREGKIHEIIEKVSPKKHTEQVLDILANMD